MIKIEKVSYKSFKRLNLHDKIAAISDPQMGGLLMSTLTPYQIAELFPRYYLDKMPDVSGFLKAVPSRISVAKQQALEEQLKNTVSGEAAGRNIAAGGWRRKYQENINQQTARVLKPGQVPEPQLSPEQTAIIQRLQGGENIAANDPSLKFLATITPQQLKMAGLERYTNEKGEEFFKYIQPQVTEEQAKQSLSAGTIPTGGSFNDKAPAVMRRLQSEFNLTREEAAAIIGNLGHESRGLQAIQEDKPISGRGGFGWAQWTGPRRVAFENFAARNGLSITSDEANYKFLVHELRTTHADSIKKLKAAEGSYNKMVAFEQSFEGAGVKAYENRYRYMQRALGMPEATSAGKATAAAYTKEAIIAEQQRMIRQQQTAQIRGLAAAVSPGELGLPQSGQPVTYGGVRDMDAEIDFRKSHAKCGIGTRHLAGKMFGDKYFDNGLGGAAATLSRGNQYLQKSGYFKEGKGVTPEQLQDKTYRDSLPIGTVISVAGGNARGEGHVQIKIGPNQWASDFPQGDRVLTTRRDGRSYHDFVVHMPNEKGLKQLDAMGFKQNVENTQTASLVTSAQQAVSDSQVNDAGEAPPPLEVVKQQAERIEKLTPQQRIEQSVGAPPDVGPKPGVKYEKPHGQFSPDMPNQAVGGTVGAPDVGPKPGVKYEKPHGQFSPDMPNQAVGGTVGAPDVGPKPGVKYEKPMGGHTLKQEPVSSTGQVSPAPQAPAPAPMPQAPTATVKQPKAEAPSPAKKFKIDMPKFIAKVKEMDWRANMATDSMIIEGFNDDPAVRSAGVKIDKDGVMHFKDYNNPEVQKIIGDMNAKAFMTEIKEAPKVEPKKPETVPPKPDVKKAETPTSATPKQDEQAAKSETNAPPAQETDTASVTSSAPGDAPKVKAMAAGGQIQTNTDQITAYPIGGLRGDNSVVVNAQQQPIFTMNTNRESAVFNPQQQRVDIIPNQKNTFMPISAPPDRKMEDLKNTMTSAVQEMQQQFSNLEPTSQTNVPNSRAKDTQYVSDRPQSMITDMLDMAGITFKNPTAARALSSRPNFQETGGPEAHYSYGNNAHT